jgi:hypothetical protein
MSKIPPVLEGAFLEEGQFFGGFLEHGNKNSFSSQMV